MTDGFRFDKASDVTPGPGFIATALRRYRATTLNTFDAYGAQEYQHHLSDAQLPELVGALQPDAQKVKNIDCYFQRRQPIGCALRLSR